MKDLGLRAEGLGFRVQGLGFGVWGLGFRVWDLGIRVGFGVWGLGPIASTVEGSLRGVKRHLSVGRLSFPVCSWKDHRHDQGRIT